MEPCAASPEQLVIDVDGAVDDAPVADVVDVLRFGPEINIAASAPLLEAEPPVAWFFK